LRLCAFAREQKDLKSEMKMAKNINRKIYYVAVGSQNPNKIMLAKDNNRELVE